MFITGTGTIVIVAAGGGTAIVTAAGGDLISNSVRYGARVAPYLFPGDDSLQTLCRHREGE
jgi:hypothetical protein